MRNTPFRTRLAPKIGLFFLAPLVGEFLPGNISIDAIYVLIALAPLFGGGALIGNAIFAVATLLLLAVAVRSVRTDPEAEKMRARGEIDG